MSRGKLNVKSPSREQSNILHAIGGGSARLQPPPGRARPDHMKSKVPVTWLDIGLWSRQRACMLLKMILRDCPACTTRLRELQVLEGAGPASGTFLARSQAR